MKDAKVTAKDINEIVLVGGMTRMPKIIEVVKEFLDMRTRFPSKRFMVGLRAGSGKRS